MRYASLFLLWAVVACYPALVPADHPGPLPTGTEDDCRASCETRRRLGCASAAPTPEGALCEAVCENIESSGYASMNPRCLARIKSCAEEDACADAQ